MKKRWPVTVLLIVILMFLTGVWYLTSHAARPVAADGGDFIKWVEFPVPKAALSDALALAMDTRTAETPVSLPEALAYLATKTYGSFDHYRSSLLEPLTAAKPGWQDDLANQKLFRYYCEAYDAAVGGLVGPYTRVTTDADGRVTETEAYGLRAFSPIAAGYYYTDYDDFGASRSYGYKRSHLGHDMLGSIGTPIIAVESGRVEACGWNQYGGWRIGIRSFDGKRYYYYAHLRKDHPFHDMYEGKIVDAGEVIGYLGMTGYSARENVNGINIPHLHFGLELIFDESQKDGYNQIWIDVYALTQFLHQNRSVVTYDKTTKEYTAATVFVYPETPD